MIPNPFSRLRYHDAPLVSWDAFGPLCSIVILLTFIHAAPYYLVVSC
jgi:hypothetical protein